MMAQEDGMNELDGKVALVAGATRGAGRGIALELAGADATVYVTGRSTRAAASPMGRPETIEETAELAAASGGNAIAVRVDHSRPAEVAALIDRIRADHGRLDVLVNDVWGGDPLTEWDVPFFRHDLENGIALLRQAVETHIVTTWHAAPLMIERPGGLVVEVTDSISARYRGSFFYDLAKSTVIRLAANTAEELHGYGVAAVALTPGFLRSEAVLDHFGVSAERWHDAVAHDPHFAASETPAYIGRAVVALAADPDVMRRSGGAFATWGLAREYGFTDVDGTQPDWAAHARETLGWDLD
jgi:NAD(P)-dependent dehydrogenase (short-subunit alcohol dehydrogenase family)